MRALFVADPYPGLVASGKIYVVGLGTLSCWANIVMLLVEGRPHAAARKEFIIFFDWIACLMTQEYKHACGGAPHVSAGLF